MPYYVQGADDDWGAKLCEVLEAREPFKDIDEIERLWMKPVSIPTIDLSVDLSNLSQYRVAIESDEFKGWWSKVQGSSALISRRPLSSEAWLYLMDILSRADVSRIEHMLLKYNDTLAFDQLGNALSRSDFCNLKTLILDVDRRSSSVFKNIPQIANALRGSGLMNLQKLSFPYSLLRAVAIALADESCRLSQLTSLSLFVNGRDDLSTLDTIFKSGKSLQWLRLVNVLDAQFSEVEFIKGLNSQNFPRLVFLFLDRHFYKANLAELFRGSREWFSSLETIKIHASRITSEQVCTLVNTLMEDPKTRLALTNLDFEDNELDHRGVLALVRLADSDGLPRLQRLHLGLNACMSNSLVTLVQSVGKGSLPSLRTLHWNGNRLKEADLESVVQAYYEDQSLTTEIIGIMWDHYHDWSWETKFKTYRDRNLRLAHLRGKFMEDFGKSVPLTSAKVFLSGFPYVGKNTLRRALRRSPGKMTILNEFLKKPFQEPRTRGIEIRRIEAEKF